MPECLESLKQLPAPHCSAGSWKIAAWWAREQLGPCGAAHTQPSLGGRAVPGWPQEQFLPAERRQQALHLWVPPENAQFPVCHQLVCSQIPSLGRRVGSKCPGDGAVLWAVCSWAQG